MAETTDTYELALGVLTSTPAQIAALFEPLSPEVWAWSPAPGEWSPRDVLVHMLYVETAVIPVRVRQMLDADGAALARPEPASESAPPAQTDVLLAAWQSARAENLTFLRSLTPAQLAQGGIHSTYGRITAREHITEWAYHDLEHLRQLHATIEARLYPAIGGFRALYSPPYPTDEPGR